MAVSRKSTAQRARASKPTKRIDWHRFDALSDREIGAAVKADPDAAPLVPPDWIKKARLVTPPEKQLISIRVDKDVLDYFRSRPRYQTRINAILRMVMEGEKAGD